MLMLSCVLMCFFSSRRRHTRCALVTGVQTCALPIYHQSNGGVARSPASPSVHRTDLGLALVLLGVCAFLWWDTTQFADVPASLAQNAPPTTFPRLLLGAIALMSLMLPFEHRFKDDGGEGKIGRAHV